MGMNAVKKARQIPELEEVDGKEKLFVVKPHSNDENTYFLDLREDSPSYYAYGIHEQIPKEQMKQEPSCVKKVKSFKEAEGSDSLDSFV
jgi:hypothetical protein